MGAWSLTGGIWDQVDPVGSGSPRVRERSINERLALRRDPSSRSQAIQVRCIDPPLDWDPPGESRAPGGADSAASPRILGSTGQEIPETWGGEGFEGWIPTWIPKEQIPGGRCGQSGPPEGIKSRSPGIAGRCLDSSGNSDPRGSPGAAQDLEIGGRIGSQRPARSPTPGDPASPPS